VKFEEIPRIEFGQYRQQRKRVHDIRGFLGQRMSNLSSSFHRIYLAAHPLPLEVFPVQFRTGFVDVLSKMDTRKEEKKSHLIGCQLVPEENFRGDDIQTP